MSPLAYPVALLVLLTSTRAAIDDGYSTDGPSQMGPAAFMWPKDRVWSAAMDSTPPCGSVATPDSRSQFPLDNGKVALLDQYESYNVQLSVSYLSNPGSNSDFDALIDADGFKEIDRGHTCVSVPKAPSSVKAGQNATLQIKYSSDEEDNRNETYYACADIEYVNLSDFDYEVPCFNATEESDPKSSATDESDPTSSATTSSADHTAASASTNTSSSVGNPHTSTGLSGGAIAGIVIGVVVGAALVLSAAFIMYRRRSQRLTAARQRSLKRGVEVNSYPLRTTASTSNPSLAK